MTNNSIKIIRAVTVSQSCGFYTGIVPELQEQGYEVVSVSSPGPELQGLREMGVRCVEVPMERRMAPWKDLKSLWNLIQVFRKERPYMVHSMTPKAGLLCMLAAWLTRVPRRVHTFTGLVWPTSTGMSRRILMLTDWLTCACATHIIPEGKGVMDDLQRHITRKPMRVLGYGNVMGVDMAFWKKENADKEQVARIKDASRFTFLFVGRIVKDKGIDELVEAFLKLRKQRPMRLLLVGKFEDALDPISDKARKAIETCEDIEYVGPQYGKDLLAHYAAADCFVFPSYREGFPNTVLEAGAMELPSVVTDINGSREIIEDGRNGLIVPSKNASAFREAMERMLTDDAMRQRMAGAAREIIATRFEQGFVRKCLLDFYGEIISR